MISDEYYYNYFLYDNIKTNNYNTTIYNSIYCNKLVLSPTVSPFSYDHIVFLSYDINKNISEYKAIDIYYNKDLILEMFNIYKNIIKLNKTYVLINNIETGSLPEVYHFHILTNNFELEIDDNDKEKISNNFYKIK